jgi:transposase
MRRDDICLYLGPAARAELQALLTNRNTARKLVWCAAIILATADGHGSFEIMRRARTSKPTVWRWQQRYLDEGVAGFKRDKTRPSRVPPLPMETRLKVIAKTVQETPANATHWRRALMAEAMGISPSSVGRIWAEVGLKPHLIKGFESSVVAARDARSF